MWATLVRLSILKRSAGLAGCCTEEYDREPVIAQTGLARHTRDESQKTQSYSRGLLDCHGLACCTGSMIENQLMVLGAGLHRSIAFKVLAAHRA